MVNFVTYTNSAQANFTVQPVPVVQTEGLTAVFECQYPGATGYFWTINGTSPSQLPPDQAQDVMTSGSILGSSVLLTITARPEYNNTAVQCEAIVRVEGSFQLVLSDSGTFLVQGML